MTLETKRLILREWNENDVEDIVEGLNNIEVSKWLAFVPYPYTKKDAEEWIKFCVENAKKGIARTSYDFAVELKSERKVIGGVSLDKINKFQETAGGGIWINAKYHGQGYGTEAFGKKIEYAFNELKLRRLENGFLDGNPSSFKMQEKFGYKIEGMRRKAFRCMADGEIKDEYITGLLKDEWIIDLFLIEPSKEYQKSFQSYTLAYGRINDNHYFNKYKKALENFDEFLNDLYKFNKGIDLPQGRVPFSTFWLIHNDEVVGVVRVRHIETEETGHIGYDISPMCRNKGYGTQILRLALKKAFEMGIKDAILTCKTDNIASRRVIEKNNGVLLGAFFAKEKNEDMYKFSCSNG